MRLLFRVVMLLVAVYAGLSVIRGLFGPKLPRRPGGVSTISGHLVKDPVCGMYIPQATALPARDQFFCSETCRQKFLT
jgi:hypothetical protein